MDPVSLAGTIVGLAGFALSTAQAIYTYIDSSSNSSSTARELANELRLLSTVLKDLGKFLESEKAQENCEKRLSSLVEKLGPTENGRLTKVLKWSFKEKGILQEIATLHQYVLVFQLSVTTDGLALLCQSFSAVEKTLKAQVTALEIVMKGISDIKQEASMTCDKYKQILDLLATLKDQADVMARIDKNLQDTLQGVNGIEHKEFLNWVSPLDQTGRHGEIRQHRTHGTAEWVLRSTEFRTWYTSSVPQKHQQSSNLWCHGIPGSGKTVIASLIIDFLAVDSTADGTDSKIVYFYFDHKSQSTQTSLDVVRCLLEQMLVQMDHIPSYIEALLKSYKMPITPPEDSQFRNALTEAIRDAAKVFVVFDGLDECGDRPRDRATMLDLLEELSLSSANILVTSRPHAENIIKHLESWNQLEIVASHDDIRRFLTSQFELHDDPSVFDEELKRRVSDNIASISTGSFLLPVLQMGSVLDQNTPDDVETVLDHLSAAPDDEYDKFMMKIQQQSGNQGKLAMTVLMWLSQVLRLMTVAELQHALAAKIGVHAINSKKSLISPETFIQCCLGLVVMEHDSANQRLHPTKASHVILLAN